MVFISYDLMTEGSHIKIILGLYPRMGMIKINDKEKLLSALRDLDADLEAGNISKRAYKFEKSELTQELETLEAADRIRRLQGRKTEDKTLDYWSEKSKTDKDQEKKDELIKKYVTTPEPVAAQKQSSKGGIPKLGIFLAVFMALGFVVGGSYGIYLFNLPSDEDLGPVLVNETAFPIFNNSANITHYNKTKSNSTSSSGGNSTPTPTPTPTPGGNSTP
jgi:hypothetical protein